jgi:hypothetical protein
MGIKTDYRNFIPDIKTLLISFLFLILTFPKILPVLDIGIDPPLLWAYNYFFAYGIQSGKDIIFTHGPLAFILSPLPIGNNLILAILISCFIKLLFIFSFLKLGKIANSSYWWVHLFLIAGLSFFLDIEYQVIGLTSIGILIHYETNKSPWLIVAILTATIGIFVRANIGIVSLLTLFSYTAIQLILNRNYKPLLAVITLIPVSIAFFWLVIYHNLTGLTRYLYGIYQFAGNSSSAVSVYPENNWWWLSASMILFALVPIVANKKKAWIFFTLFLLPLYAEWIHGISREDFSHLRGFFLYLIFFFSLFIILFSEVRKITFLLIILLLALFSLNLKNAINYSLCSREIVVSGNLLELIFDHKELLDQSKILSEQNIKSVRLDSNCLKIIGTKTVDVYPWNFAFIPANNLNWVPRPVLQTYASYKPWLDKQNADHFASARAPDFLIWELLTDRYGGQLGSIDNRYLLNDEPMTIISILNHYHIIYKNGKILLLAKNNHRPLSDGKTIGSCTALWDQWIKVPKNIEGILRAKIHFPGNLLRKLRTLVYKDIPFYIEYKLQSGDLCSYRIIPSTTPDGVWINPLIMHPSTGFIEPMVTEIRLFCPNKRLMQDGIEIEWELIPVKPTGTFPPDSMGIAGKSSAANEIFLKYLLPVDNSTLTSVNEFEKPVMNWESNKTNYSTSPVYQGNKSYKLDKNNPFSPTFGISFKDISKDSLKSFIITASLQAFASNFGLQAGLIISADNDGKTIYWQSAEFSDFVIRKDCWQPVFIYRKLPVSIPKSARLNVFVWNSGKKPVWIDNLKVTIYKD